MTAISVVFAIGLVVGFAVGYAVPPHTLVRSEVKVTA